MRRNRRLVLTDRIIPFLAAFVGLVALGGAVVVQLNANARTQWVAEEIASLRADIETLAARATDLDAAERDRAIEQSNGTVEALLALQDRMNALETEWADRPVATAASGGVFSASPDGAPSDIDPDWPTDDCIPIGTRFMASIGDELAICQSPVVVRVSAVSGDNVLIEGAGVINETASRIIPGSNCSLMVFDANEEGFAEMRVSCN